MEISDIRQQQTQKAKELRQQMPALQKEQQAQVQNRGREDLARQMSGVRQNFGTRGLLYSGLRRGAESQAAGNVAAQGAQQIAQGNALLSGQLEQAEGNAIQTGLQEQELKQREADRAYEQALAARAQKSQGMASAAGGIGSLAGMFAGGR